MTDIDLIRFYRETNTLILYCLNYRLQLHAQGIFFPTNTTRLNRYIFEIYFKKLDFKFIFTFAYE